MPANMLDILDAPVPFFVGVHHQSLANAFGEDYDVERETGIYIFHANNYYYFFLIFFFKKVSQYMLLCLHIILSLSLFLSSLLYSGGLYGLFRPVKAP